MSINAYFNPPDFSGAGVVNTAAWRSAQVPSANAHATAAGIARVYTALAAGGALPGVRVVTSAALAAATQEQVYGEDLVLARPSRFGLSGSSSPTPSASRQRPRCFGHFGAGLVCRLLHFDARLAVGFDDELQINCASAISAMKYLMDGSMLYSRRRIRRPYWCRNVAGDGAGGYHPRAHTWARAAVRRRGRRRRDLVHPRLEQGASAKTAPPGRS